MSVDWTLQPSEQLPIVVLLGVAVLFPVFHYFLSAETWAQRRNWARNGAYAVYGQRLSGFVVLGVIPAITLFCWPAPMPTSMGLGPVDLTRTGLWVTTLLSFALPAIWWASRRPMFLEHYPQIRESGPWSRRQIVLNGVSWALYLLGYESLFRGCLLFTTHAAFGAWPAVAFTTLAYVLAHLPKNAQETLSTIPMGLIFAWGALWTGGIWGPWFAHVVIATWSDRCARMRQDTGPMSKRG